MPATPEHKARMFGIAVARKKSGLPVWNKKIQVEDILKLDDAIKAGQEISKRITEQLAEYLDSSEALAYDDELADIEYEFRHVADTEDFNNVLDQFYDWADEKRVWLA